MAKSIIIEIVSPAGWEAGITHSILLNLLANSIRRSAIGPQATINASALLNLLTESIDFGPATSQAMRIP